MGRYIVFGAGGFVGSHVANELIKRGHDVVGTYREMNEDITTELKDVVVQGNKIVDVSEQSFSLTALSEQAKEIGVDGIIYAVGHCPPGGAKDAMIPLSKISLDSYDNEYRMHQRGVINVFQYFAPVLVDGGAMTFVSSAITRMLDFKPEQLPPGFYAHYHMSVIAAEDALIEGMRCDPVTVEKKLKIHRISPAAIDSPFHDTAGGLQPPKMVPIKEVVENVVLSTLNAKNHFSVQLLG